MFKFKFDTLKTKSFWIGVIQIVAGSVMLKTGVMSEAGAVRIANGAQTLGLRDAITKGSAK